MNPKGKINRALVVSLLLGLLTAIVGYVAHDFRLFQPLTRASYDLFLIVRGDRPATNAVIVYLDERSHLELQQPQNAPWDRSLHAQLVERLTAAGAKAIVFDVVFSDPSVAGEPADRRFAEAIKASGRVLLAADRVPIGGEDYQTIMPTPVLREALLNQDTDAMVGSAEVIPDPDLVVRQLTPEINEVPSLAWAAARFVGAPITRTGNSSAGRWMNYYGRPGSVLSVSYCDVLTPGKVAGGFFEDKVVFVGSRIITKFAGERKDEYRNPFGLLVSKGALFVPGVEIQATACMNLIRGDWLRRLPLGIELTILVITGLLVGYSLMRLQPLVATGVAAGFLLLAYGVCYVAVLNLSWFVFFIVVVQVAFALLISVSYNSLQAYVAKRLAEQTLALYLSPKLVKKFSAGGNPELLKPGARKQEVTLFFSDVEDFTKQSEGLDSDELAHVMNEYFDVAVSRAIHKTDGTVVKYIGDAIFAFWNAPDLQADHALRACQAMLHFRDNVPREIRGLKLHTRIGLHTGVANVGNFGSVERVDYTALGENVNLASRLEGLNKYLGTTYLLSGATLAGVGQELVTREVGRFKLKGFETAVAVYELVGWPDEAETTRPWRDAFRAALESYRRGDLPGAREGFAEVLRLKPEDGPSIFYLERIAESDGRPAPASWTGEVQLKEK